MSARGSRRSIYRAGAPHTPCSQPTCVAGERLMLAQEIRQVQPRLDFGWTLRPLMVSESAFTQRHACFCRPVSVQPGPDFAMYSSFTFFVSRSFRTADRSMRSARSEANPPPNIVVASVTTIGAVSMAPITARNTFRAGSCSTPANRVGEFAGLPSG